MTEQEVINTVRTITARKLYKQPNDIKLDAAFSNDLGADSLDIMEIAINLSKHFEIPANEFEDQDIHTIDDIVDIICKYLKISRSTDKDSSNIIALITVIGQTRQNLQKFTKRKSK